MLSCVVNILSVVLILACWFLIVKKHIANRYAPEKTVKAKVVDKYKAKTITRFHGTFQREPYVVVFQTKDKKLSFVVSEFSYANYKINEKGTLKYKGNQIISFG